MMFYSPLEQIIDEISPRSQDSIVGIGEKLACKIVAASLRDRVRAPVADSRRVSTI
jgi:aspartokinase